MPVETRTMKAEQRNYLEPFAIPKALLTVIRKRKKADKEYGMQRGLREQDYLLTSEKVHKI
jgi:hypothetical protein